MAAVSTSLQQPESIPKIKDHMSETYDESNNSNASEPPDDADHNQNRTSPKTSFSIQNVLNMKSERESPENVFATEQLLKNTPNFPYRRIMSPRNDEAEISDNFESPKHLERSSNYGSPQRNDSCSIPSPKTDERKSERSYSDNYSNPNSEINIDDEVSCCSEDTVLSVGNEAPIHSFGKNTDHNPQMTNPGLTSFKHIQTHLNAISQLSQNLSMTQPLLLRPNPLPANPLLFINQPLLFQNPMISPNQNKDLPQPNRLQPQLNQFSLRNIKSQRNNVDENRIQHPTDYDEARREMLNQNCLKFSIDNILKADFGRRITDPLHKRKSSVKSRPVYESPKELESPNKEQRVPEIDKTGEKSGAIDLTKEEKTKSSSDGPMVWPAWVYCTRYSDRPSSGRSPRTRRPKKPPGEAPSNEEKRPRTAFSGPQLARLKHEFAENRYLTERRRQSLAAELGLAEAQIKIWFQNKRAKIKKASGQRNPLALQLMAQGLYNHSTVPLSKEEEELEMKAREREKQLQSR